MQKQKNTTTFQQFRKYCSRLVSSFNEIPHYTSKYTVSTNPFLKQHDGEYLSIQHTSEKYLIKINILHSLPYQIPILYFMIYDIEDSSPLSCDEIYEKYINCAETKKLNPSNAQTGIYISQQPITKQYLYTLHSCQLNLQAQYLLPFYLSLLGLHPQIKLQDDK